MQERRKGPSNSPEQKSLSVKFTLFLKKSYSQNLQYLLLSLPRRIQGVLENGGIAIKY